MATVRRNPPGGSSPLTRGGLTLVVVPSSSVRLIPAYAGRTHSPASFVLVNPAHPRLRGADHGRHV